ncbi:MAG: DUF4236 domain-containing protein [Cytophagales bacterium]
MRFRKRAKLFPGVYLNFSKSGISTTIGVRGASVNFNKQGTFLNTGIPGTGLYDRQKIGGGKKGKQNLPTESPVEMQPIEETGSIKSEQAESTTTEGLQELKKTLLDCYQERIDLKKEIVKVKGKLIFYTILLMMSYLLIFGFFVKWFKENRSQTKEYLADLKNQLENCYVNIDMQLDPKIEERFSQLLEDYKQVISSEKIWDITSSISIDQKSTRSAASASVTRKQVKFGFRNIDIVKSEYNALHFENANGGDLYIYPAFIAIVDSKKKFGLVDIRELNFDFHGQRFLEEEKVPKDSQVVGQTWAKVNKNGTPDKRFKDNYQIPICLYGEFSLTSKTGLNEAYSISSYEKAEKFARSMEEFKMTIK